VEKASRQLHNLTIKSSQVSSNNKFHTRSYIHIYIQYILLNTTKAEQISAAPIFWWVTIKNRPQNTKLSIFFRELRFWRSFFILFCDFVPARERVCVIGMVVCVFNQEQKLFSCSLPLAEQPHLHFVTLPRQRDPNAIWSRSDTLYQCT